MLNAVVLEGRLTADPELKHTQNDVAVTSFSIANDRDYTQNGNKLTDFPTIVAWRTTAEFVCRNFRKGKRIIVVGKLESRKYETTEGKKVTVWEVVAEKVYFAGDRENTERTQNTSVSNDANEPDIDYGDLPF